MLTRRPPPSTSTWASPSSAQVKQAVEPKRKGSLGVDDPRDSSYAIAGVNDWCFSGVHDHFDTVHLLHLHTRLPRRGRNEVNAVELELADTDNDTAVALAGLYTCRVCLSHVQAISATLRPTREHFFVAVDTSPSALQQNGQTEVEGMATVANAVASVYDESVGTFKVGTFASCGRAVRRVLPTTCCPVLSRVPKRAEVC